MVKILEISREDPISSLWSWYEELSFRCTDAAKKIPGPHKNRTQQNHHVFEELRKDPNKDDISNVIQTIGNNCSKQDNKGQHTIDGTKPDKREKEEKQTGAELCQAQPKLSLLAFH